MSAGARTPFIFLIVQSSHKPTLAGQLKWIYWCFGLEAAQRVRVYQWILACMYLSDGSLQKCMVSSERGFWHFMVSSFLPKQLYSHQCHRDDGLCWSCPDNYRCQRGSLKDCFIWRCKLDVGKLLHFRHTFSLLYQCLDMLKSFTHGLVFPGGQPQCSCWAH